MEIQELIGLDYFDGSYTFKIQHAKKNDGFLLPSVENGGPEIIVADGEGTFFAFNPANLEPHL